jgi:hypothetical protein
MKKQVRKEPVKNTPLANYIGLVGHDLSASPTTDKEKVFALKVPVVDIPVYQQPIRIEYKDELVPGSKFLYTKKAVGLSNMPKPIRGVTYVISRNALEAITKANRAIGEAKELGEMIELLAETEDPKTLTVRKALKKKRAAIIAGLPYMEPRHDFVAPGDRIKDALGKAQFCLGFVSEID